MCASLGRHYSAEVRNRVVYDVDRSSAGFGTSRVTAAGLSTCSAARFVVADPSGTRAYFAVRPDACAGAALALELDVATWTVRRSIALGGNRVDCLTLRGALGR